MKFHLKISAVLTAVMLVIPTPALFFSKNKTDKNSNNGEKINGSYFDVLDTSSGTITRYTDRDYLIGVVSAEMPASYPVEALKAQAVAAYTVACRRRNAQREKPDESMKGADITSDSKIDQAFITEEKQKEKWGENAEVYRNKISAAVDAVLFSVLTYEDKLADTLFFAISNGKTENAVNVWGNEIPYLVSVDSAGDLTASGYLTTQSLSKEDFKALCSENGINLPESVEKWVGEQTLTESDRVKTQVIGDKTLTGKEMRSIFSLRSTCFALTFEENTFTFTVRGYGHGVGMSQYGAKYMAEQGAAYKDILAWYYPGTVLKNLSDVNLGYRII